MARRSSGLALADPVQLTHELAGKTEQFKGLSPSRRKADERPSSGRQYWQRNPGGQQLSIGVSSALLGDRCAGCVTDQAR